MVNVAIYTIHGSYGIYGVCSFACIEICLNPKFEWLSIGLVPHLLTVDRKGKSTCYDLGDDWQSGLADPSWIYVYDISRGFNG